MGKFFKKLLGLILVIVIAMVVGMISPGQWLSDRKRDVNSLYNKMVRFRDVPVAEKFLPSLFGLDIHYLENTEGKVEVYLVNTERAEMLPIFEVEGTTQVGDVNHRLRGIGEEGRSTLRELLENAKSGSSSAFDKALQLLGK